MYLKNKIFHVNCIGIRLMPLLLLLLQLQLITFINTFEQTYIKSDILTITNKTSI